jgi:hypothetical protein
MLPSHREGCPDNPKAKKYATETGEIHSLMAFSAVFTLYTHWIETIDKSIF